LAEDVKTVENNTVRVLLFWLSGQTGIELAAPKNAF